MLWKDKMLIGDLLKKTHKGIHSVTHLLLAKKKKKNAARKTVKSYRDWHKSDNKNDIKCYYYDKSEGIWRCGRYVYLVCLKLEFTLVKNGCRCIEIKARLLSTKSSRFWTLAETCCPHSICQSPLFQCCLGFALKATGWPSKFGI